VGARVIAPLRLLSKVVRASRPQSARTRRPRYKTSTLQNDRRHFAGIDDRRLSAGIADVTSAAHNAGGTPALHIADGTSAPLCLETLYLLSSIFTIVLMAGF
jgi:hypothetical protein